MGGLHWLAWVFILLALAALVRFIVSASFSPTPSIVDFVVYVLQVLPAVVAILFPTALLARHPDAASRMPLVLLGTILFALVQGLSILAGPLQVVFETITPPSADLPTFVPLAEIYNGLTSLLAAGALGLMARGLSLARRAEDTSGRWIEFIVPVATVFATIVGILAVSNLVLPDPLSPVYVAFLGASVALGILRVAAWGYLATSALRGWLAGDQPKWSWGMASAAGAVVIVALVVVNLRDVFDVQDPTLVQVFGWVITIAYAVGHLCLLAAFATGLPAPDDLDDPAARGDRGEPVFDDEFPEERRRARVRIGR